MGDLSALQANASTFTIADAASVALILVGSDGIIRHANPIAATLFGATVDRNLVGRSMPELLGSHGVLGEAVADGRAVDGASLAVATLDGRKVALEWSFRPIAEGGGVATVTDVTRARTEESEAQFQKILLRAQSDTSLDGILVVSPESKFISINRRFVELWRLPKTVFDSKDDEVALKWVLGQVADPDGFIAKVGYLYSHPDEESNDEILLRDGRIFDRYSAPVRGDDGAHYGRVWFFRDVSARKSAEGERDRLFSAEQQARREAERASHAKDEFLAIVSHELRTPLTAVLGWAHILRSTPMSRAAEEKAIATIERNAQLQATLIEDLLEVSRALSGKTVLEVGPVELDRLVDAAIDAIKPAIAAKRIVLHTRIDSGRLQIDGDADRLQQVAYNLLSNAIKFTPAGGAIHVELTRVGDHATLEVKDNGLGIEADFLPHVFERFRQSDTSTTRNHGGLGLGLAIVRHFVELHGGVVRAASEGKGRGATLTVELPVRAVLAGRGPTAAKRATKKSRMSDLAAARILVVDDHRDGRELVSAALAAHGAVVEQADCAEAALTILAGQEVDVLVSDLSMPDVDGYGLLERLRTSGLPNRGLPVIALTAHASPVDRERATDAGFDDYLTKPVDPDVLALAVERALFKGKRAATSHHRLRATATPRRKAR